MNRFDSDLLSRISLYLIEPDYQRPQFHRIAFPAGPGDTLTANVSTLSETGQLMAQRALMAWTEVTGIRFELVDSEDAHIRIYDTRTAFSSKSVKDGVILSSEVYVSAQGISLSDGSISSRTFKIFLHEIGHALGFSHPAPYEGPTYLFGEDAVFSNDSWQATVMSYFTPNQNPNIDASFVYTVTPMIADIIAMHDLYGAPILRAGDTIYGVGSNVGGHLGQVLTDWTAGNLDGPITLTLLDNGGIDTLNFSTDTDDQHVVLQPETASDVYGLVGNLVIARDTLIENYVAGAGDDIIVGNDADNILEGSAGADSLDGGEGSDTAAYTGSASAGHSQPGHKHRHRRRCPRRHLHLYREPLWLCL